ncbi:TetR/AcrR family transcriptional regulator [Rhodococcus artemisiae]|uniref:TetR/AcrR family transcriptional regulator n=1 Tax=Rhodococcus artemisiae TaxID=714159 RepID=A0ABU7L793_9NOCA|nr:TetR/AcrR family transcriptional regulator [Rhodococcus artemisiae]MEE2057414.1 TetR/AcrR family transcriptional regulator [Rhodococcus artemisiae]
MSEAAPEPGSAPSLTEALWPDPPRTKRGPKPRLTRDEIVSAAAATADTDGIDAVTMQRVADVLGVAKMSLYRYVPGKTELVALALDHALGNPPALRSGPWRDRLRGWAIELHRRMSAHPWSLDITVGTRIPGPHELAWFEEGLLALRETPLDGSQRLDVLAMLTFHVRGSAQQKSGSDRPEAELAELLGPILATHSDRFPETAAAFADRVDGARRDDAFSFGLDRILDGVATLTAE